MSHLEVYINDFRYAEELLSYLCFKYYFIPFLFCYSTVKSLKVYYIYLIFYSIFPTVEYFMLKYLQNTSFVCHLESPSQPSGIFFQLLLSSIPKLSLDYLVTQILTKKPKVHIDSSTNDIYKLDVSM